MRPGHLVLALLVAASALHAQEPDPAVFGTPAPTVTGPTSPAQPAVIYGSAPSLPSGYGTVSVGVAQAAPLAATWIAPTMGADEFTALVQATSTARLAAIFNSAATSIDTLANLLVISPASVQQGALAALAQNPIRLVQVIAATANQPQQSRALLAAVQAGGFMAQVEVAVSQRAATAQVKDMNVVDADVLAAMCQFAALDTRYREISPFTAFGGRLADVKAQIAEQGMTPENKAALLKVYVDATAALKVFLARERAANGRR